MADDRYCDLWQSPPEQRVTTVGNQPGNDNWTKLGSLPVDRVPVGAGQYVIVISGKIGDVLFAGTGGERGLMQVALGTAGGAIFGHMQIAHPVRDLLGAQEGVPFLFVVSINSREPDAVLGSSIDLSATELCLWGRSFTNWGPQTWYAEFTVFDVNWLWWDVDTIPSSEWECDVEEWAPATAFPGTPPAASIAHSTPTFGQPGELWLNFASIRYQTRTHLAVAPAFEFVTTPDGTWAAHTTMVGSDGQHGINRTGPPVPIAYQENDAHHGGLWVWTNTTGTTRAGFAAVEAAAATFRTYIRRWAWFAVRIDTLPDVLTRWSIGLPGGVREVDAWQDTYITRERPKPTPGILTHPIVLTQQIVRWHNSLGAYGTRITEDLETGRFKGDRRCFSKVDPARLESLTSIAMARRVFVHGSPAMQYRVHAVGSDASPPGVQVVRDFQFIQFHPVRDPSNLSTPPPNVANAVILVPGRQSPSPAALLAPPVAPNATAGTRYERDVASIADDVGYAPRWPLGARPMKVVSLVWGALSIADAAAVLSFLQTNRTWRWTDHGQVDRAVMTIAGPDQQPVGGHKRATVTATVAVLTYVDP